MWLYVHYTHASAEENKNTLCGYANRRIFLNTRELIMYYLFNKRIITPLYMTSSTLTHQCLDIHRIIQRH